MARSRSVRSRLAEHTRTLQLAPTLPRPQQPWLLLLPADKAIDLVDEAAAKLKMEITSKPLALDEVGAGWTAQL